MMMKLNSTEHYTYPSCDRQEDDDDDDDKSIMLEDLDTYKDDIFNNKEIPKYDQRPTSDNRSGRQFVIMSEQGQCRVKTEPDDDGDGGDGDDDDGSMSYDDYDDDDDDDDKSVMLEDLDPTNAQLRYNRAKRLYHEHKRQQMRAILPTRCDLVVRTEQRARHQRGRVAADDDDDKSVMLDDIERKRAVIPKFIEIEPRDCSDDDIENEDADSLCIPKDEDFRPQGNRKHHKTKKQNNYCQNLLIVPKRRTRRRTPQLWVFLLNALLNPELNPSIIEWKDKKRGVFKLKNTKKIAQIWGQRIKKDPKKPMDYEKFSRAIRYYYHKRVIMSVPGRLTYQFGPQAIGWKRAVQNANSPVK